MIPSTLPHHHSEGLAPSLDSWIYSLFSSSSDPIIACDLQGNICAWNHGAQQTFGIHPKQSLGRNLNRLFLCSSNSTSEDQEAQTAATATVAAIPKTNSANSAIAASISTSATATAAAAAAKSPRESELYPTTPEQVQAIKAASIKRIVSRTVKDHTQHLFLESVSAVFEQPAAATTVTSIPTATVSATATTTVKTTKVTGNGHSNGNSHRNGNSCNGSAYSGPGKQWEERNGHHSHTSKEKESSSLPTPVLVGYSVILTDLSTLSTLPLLLTPHHAQQPTLSLSPSSATITPLKPPASATSISSSSSPFSSHSVSFSAASASQEQAEKQPECNISSPLASSWSAVTGIDRETMTTSHVSRPVTSREHSTDSGFDERSPAPKPSTETSVSVSEAASEIASTAPSLLDLIPSIAAPKVTPSPSASPLPLSRSNSITLPILAQEPPTSVRTSSRSTSLGQLLALPLPLLNSSLHHRPRATSVAATAISSTSTGAQLSVSMSSSPDKSRLDIHHNSLALSNDSRPSSLLSGELRLDREWDDPYFSYLAPIATSLLTCHGEHFFDLVCEELAINLGVKYAFISQLVSLEELKELDPTEYMNLIEQFGGLVPPIDGVMHNISSWPGESHINPHAFQGYLADCTIQDKVTFLKSSLADQYQDVAECLMDHTIESYVGMRLETAQGEIVGVIGIIHDRPLTEEDGSIVKVVLDQVGIRVANELDRLRVEANLIYARDVAESTAKNKTKFLADMSHEIRNPMNAVVGVTDILLDTAGLSSEQTSYIEVIRTSGQHLLTVINDILDISRIDQDVKFLLERRPLSLRKCLKDAVSLAGLTPLHDVSRSISVIEWPPEMDDLGPFSELEETNILPLLWSIDHNVPEHLLGDITRLRQVLINLCTNSLKFTQRGRVSVHVSVHKPTAQYPTIRPNSSPTVTRNLPNGGQVYYPGEASSSSPSSPMLTGSDHRTQMVFQQRYDVKADNSQVIHAKPSPASTRRRAADKRHLPSTLSSTHDHTVPSTFGAPSLTVVAPTANSLEGDKMDENTVILEFAVSDTGVGIPANKITELFTSFSQVDISVSTRFGGTGLGLAISASLVEKMGGNIWVESTEGVGSRFTFTIPFTVCQSSETDSHPSATAPSSPVSAPMRQETSDQDQLNSFQLPESSSSSSSSSSSTGPSQQQQQQQQQQSELSLQEELSESVKQIDKCENISTGTLTPTLTASAEPSKPSSPSYAKVVESSLRPLTINGAPLRILLAEDNAVNQKIAVGVLKKLGYENVDVAENGLEVIDKLDQGSIYDVILMDVSMPVMDGIDATKAIVDRRTRGLLYAAAERCTEKTTTSITTATTEEQQQGEDSTSNSSNNDSEGAENVDAKKFQDYLNLYVIALTASAMGSDKERCMEAGMDDFMTKPFALLEMKRVLNEFINKWNDGALQSRNEACLSAALTAKSRCNSPYCQGGGGTSSQKDGSSRSLTPTLGNNNSNNNNNNKPSSANSSTMNLAESGLIVECLGCCGGGSGDQNMNGNGSSEALPSSGSSSPPPSSSSSSRACRMETPRPLRRNLDGIGCSLFSSPRRSHSDAMMNGLPGSITLTGGPLGGPATVLESALMSRRASDAFSFTKREWRSSGLGNNGESSHQHHGAHDIHPLEVPGEGSGLESHQQQHESGGSNSFPPHPQHLRVKRVMSPSSLSREHQDPSSLRPMASPLSPLSLLTTDTEGSSSVSPPLSLSTPSSPTEEEVNMNGRNGQNGTKSSTEHSHPSPSSSALSSSDHLDSTVSDSGAKNVATAAATLQSGREESHQGAAVV